MRNLTLAFLVFGTLAQPAAAWAASFPDNGRPIPALVRPVAPRVIREDVKPRYPMNYTDEAAQTLGLRDGRLDLFSSQPSADNPLMPALSGGVSGNGAMLRLQWR